MVTVELVHNKTLVIFLHKTVGQEIVDAQLDHHYLSPALCTPQMPERSFWLEYTTSGT